MRLQYCIDLRVFYFKWEWPDGNNINWLLREQTQLWKCCSSDSRPLVGSSQPDTNTRLDVETGQQKDDRSLLFEGSSALELLHFSWSSLTSFCSFNQLRKVWNDTHLSTRDTARSKEPRRFRSPENYQKPLLSWRFLRAKGASIIIIEEVWKTRDSSQSRAIWRKETWPRIHWSLWLSSKNFQ